MLNETATCYVNMSCSLVYAYELGGFIPTFCLQNSTELFAFMWATHTLNVKSFSVHFSADTPCPLTGSVGRGDPETRRL